MLAVFLISVIAGALGAILGLGGGLIIVPALTLFYGVGIRYAIGASIVSVIATSSGAAAAYVRDRITNIRVAMFLEIATTLGALTGVMLSAFSHPRALYFIFAGILAYSCVGMLRNRKNDLLGSADRSDAWATRLKLHSSYPDRVLGREVEYGVKGVKAGFSLMFGAGVFSGLLGIGSGALKVLAMDSAMGLPIRVSTATSNFMMGVTAAAGASVYFLRGDIIPELAGPVAIGVFAGAWIGTRLMVRMPSLWLRRFFVVFLFLIAVQMFVKGLRFQTGGGP